MSQDAIRMMRWSALLGSGALLFTSPTLAQEDECASDADCEHGYACEVIGGWGGCSVEPCGPDGACPPPVCENHDLLGCVPGPCGSDSDCAEGMVCHTSTSTRCSGYAVPDCPPGSDCPDLPPPEPVSCEEITESQCTPRHQLPCTADADCGEGFRCTEAMHYECDGGGSNGGTTGFGASSGITGAWDGIDEGGDAEQGEAYGTRGGADEPTGAATPAVDGPADYTCREVPSGEFYCELLELPCEVDADCPATMHCEDNDVVVCSSPTNPAGPPPAMDGGEDPTQAHPGFAEEAAAVAAERGAAPYEPDCRVLEGEPAKICRPDGYGGGGAVGGNVTGVGGGTADDGMGEGAPTGGSGDADNGGAATGGSGRDGSEGRDLHDWLRDAGGRHGHGCTIAEAESHAGDNLSLLLGVGLALGWMQRRRTR